MSQPSDSGDQALRILDIFLVAMCLIYILIALWVELT